MDGRSEWLGVESSGWAGVTPLVEEPQMLDLPSRRYVSCTQV